MIRKIVLSNFMAHAQTELKLSDGLTVLVGPNNIGKSTVAVALKILARNANSNFVMQHDQKECSISVETSEGHSIQWTKRKSPSYIINGQSKDRLGRSGTPPELDETLRLAAVEFEDKDFEPLTSAPMLIDESPLRNGTTDLSRSIAKTKYLTEQMSAHQGLHAPVPFAQTGELQAMVEDIRVLKTEHQRLAEIVRVSDIAKERPTRMPEEALNEWIQNLEKTSIDFQRVESLCGILGPMAPNPTMTDVKFLNDAIASYATSLDQSIRNQETLEDVQESINALESEAKTWIQTEPNCSTCGAKLTVESVRFRTHQHGS